MAQSCAVLILLPLLLSVLHVNPVDDNILFFECHRTSSDLASKPYSLLLVKSNGVGCEGEG